MFQAQKRKLGLLDDDDDTSKLAETDSAKESTDDFVAVGKNRGISNF